MKLNDIKKIYNSINESFDFEEHTIDDIDDELINDTKNNINDIRAEYIQNAFLSCSGDFNIKVHENIADINVIEGWLSYIDEIGFIQKKCPFDMFNKLNIDIINIRGGLYFNGYDVDINNLTINCSGNMNIGENAIANIKNLKINGYIFRIENNNSLIENTTISAEIINLCYGTKLNNVDIKTNNLWIKILPNDYRKFLKKIKLLPINLENDFDDFDELIHDLSNIDIIKILQLDNYDKDYIQLSIPTKEHYYSLSLIKNPKIKFFDDGTVKINGKKYKRFKTNKFILYKDCWYLYPNMIYNGLL